MFFRFFLISMVLLMGCSSNQKLMSEMSSEYKNHIQSLKSAKINSLNIKYIDQGKGDGKEAFLLVHGIPTSSWMYRKLIKKLSKKYRVIAPDLIGFGQSSKPRKALTFEEQAAVLRSLVIDKLGLKTINIMIHDFGGLISLSMLSNTDIKVNQAVILDTFLFKDGWNNGYSFFSNTMNQVLPEVMTGAFFEMGVRGMFMSKMPTEIIEGYVRPMKSENGTKAYSCLYNEIPTIEAKTFLKIQKTLKEKFNKNKTKIIWGKNDPFLDSKKQVKAITQSLGVSKKNVLILENGKHLIADENYKEILEFLDK